MQPDCGQSQSPEDLTRRVASGGDHTVNPKASSCSTPTPGKPSHHSPTLRSFPTVQSSVLTGDISGRCVVARQEHEATIRDLASPQLEVVTELPPCTSVKAFSPDSSLVLLNRHLCVQRGSVRPDAELRSRVVEVESGREVLDLGRGLGCIPQRSTQPGNSLAARYLAVSHDQGFEVSIYDLETGEIIGTLDSRGCRYSPLISASPLTRREGSLRREPRRLRVGARPRRGGLRGQRRSTLWCSTS